MADALVLVGGGLGHYNPIAGLVAEMHCTVAVAAFAVDDSSVARRARADGFEFVPLSASGSRRRFDRHLRLLRRFLNRLARQTAALGRSADELPSLTSRALFALGAQVNPLQAARADRLAAIECVITRTNPSVILADVQMSIGLGQVAPVPWFEYTTQPIGGDGRSRPASPAGLAPRPRGGERALNRLLAATKQLRGRRMSRMATAAVRGPVARFAFSCRMLDDYIEAPQSEFTYIGASPYRRVDVTVAKEELLFVTMGSGDEAIPFALLEALQEIAGSTRVVVQTARGEPGDLLPGAEIVPPSDGPPWHWFARARLTISHGGHGTIAESLSCDTPVLVLPSLAADRLETARRLTHHGLGRSLNRYRVRRDTIIETIRSMLDDGVLAERAALAGAALRDDAARRAIVGQISAHLAV